MATKTTSRTPPATAEDLRRQALTAVGYDIREDSDQPGYWVWVAPTDACESSYDSEAAAYAGAWADARQQAMAILDLGARDWDGLCVDDQGTAVLEALTAEAPSLQLPSKTRSSRAVSNKRQSLRFELKVNAPPHLTPAQVAKLLDRLLAVGMADASETATNQEGGDVATALDALELSFGSVRVLK